MADPQGIDWSTAKAFGSPEAAPEKPTAAGSSAGTIDWDSAKPFGAASESQQAAPQPITATPPPAAPSQDINDQMLREQINASSGLGELDQMGDADHAAGHFILGALKGLADTGHLVGAVANKAASRVTGGRVPDVVQFQTPEYLKAHGFPEQAGKVGEGVAEFFLSDGALAGLTGAEKFEKVAKVLKVLDESPNLMKAIHVGISALRMGTVGAAQSVEQQAKAGGPVDLTRAMHEGAATGMFGGALHGFNVVANLPGASAATRAIARVGQAALSIPTTLEQAKAAIEPRQPDETEAQYEERVVMSGINATLGALGMKDLIKSPEIATAAGKTAEAGKAAASAVPEKAVDIAKAGAETITQPVKQIMASPEKKLEQAVRPYISERDFSENAPRTLQYLSAENKVKPINNLEDLSEAAHNAKQKLWDSKLSTPHPGEFINGNEIAQTIKDAISPTTKRHFPDRADAIEAWADTFKGEYPLDEALGSISELNANLRNFYKLQPSEQWRAASADPKLGMLQDAADALRDSAFTKLEALGEKDIPALRKDYGALNQLQRVSEKRAVVYGRQAPIDLKTSIAGLAAVAGHPAALAIPLITKYLNSPEYLIKSAIKKYDKAQVGTSPKNVVKQGLAEPYLSPKAEAGAEPALLKAQSPYEEPHLDETPQGMDTKAVLNHELGHAAVAYKLGFDPSHIISGDHPKMKPEPGEKGKSYGAAVIDMGNLQKRADGTIPVEDLSTRIHDVLTMTMAGAAANELYDGVERKDSTVLEGDKKFAHDMLNLLDVPADLHDYYMDRAFAKAKSLLVDKNTTDVINEFSDTREKGLPQTHHYSSWRMQEFKDRIRQGAENDRDTQGITEGGAQHIAGSETVGEETAATGTSPRPAGAGTDDTASESSRLAATERHVPAERTTGVGEYDKAIKDGGAIPGGLEKGDPEIGIPDMVLFHDPTSGSTINLATHDVSAARVKEELLKSRLMFEGRKKNVGEKAAKIEQGRITGRPEWVQASFEREKNRAKDILRNPQATPEEKKYAEQVLESSGILQDNPALANLEARAAIANEKPGQREELQQAVSNTPGAEMSDEGITVDLVRHQKPEQAGERALRSGVFFTPEQTSPYQKHYTTGRAGYGGLQRVEGRETFKNPFVAKGASGGKVPERAYDAIKGKNAYSEMRNDVLYAVMRPFSTEGRRTLVQKVQDILQKYGGNPEYAADIVEHSKEGNTLPYAIQEHIVASALRAAGYDGVIGYSKVGGKMRLSEAFHLNMDKYPISSEHMQPPSWKKTEVSEPYSTKDTVSILKTGKTPRDMIMYHITPTENVSKIQQEGLRPAIGERSKQLGEKKPAVYLFPSKEEANTALGQWLGEQFEEEKPLSILEIRVPKGTRVDRSGDYELSVRDKLSPQTIQRALNEEEFGREFSDESGPGKETANEKHMTPAPAAKKKF